MDLLTISQFLKAVIWDKKMWLIVGLITLSSIGATQFSSSGEWIFALFNNLLVNCYLVVVISSIYYGKNPPEMKKILHNTTVSTLFNRQVLGVAVGILAGELVALIGMILIAGLLGPLGMVVVIFYIFIFFGKMGVAFASSSAGEAFKEIFSGFYDIKYYLPRAGEYVSYFFLTVVGVIVGGIISIIGWQLSSISLPLGYLLIDGITTFLYILGGIMGFLAVKGSEINRLL